MVTHGIMSITDIFEVFTDIIQLFDVHRQISQVKSQLRLGKVSDTHAQRIRGNSIIILPHEFK
jgi:hypothetical protein